MKCPVLDSGAMSTNLVIVESPAKARTIERYLGPGYTVLASYGHVRDLPENPGKGQLGVDVDHDFAPDYEIPAERRRQVGAIEKAGRTADRIFLATDLDREGEAIAWHVAEAAHLPRERTSRVTFSEITEPAIKAAFAHPRQINENLVDAQQTRRIVDRLVGYTLSPLLSRKVRSGLSAGRVQSVAVRLVVEREREISAFVAEEYWTVEALLESPAGARFAADLVRIDGKKPRIHDGETARRHVEALRAAHPVVRDVSVRRSKRSPAPPFTTSTLQQEASRKLGFSPKRTMSVAQRLYEGVETPDGHVGLITYMRTDSVALADQAIAEAREVVAGRFGDALRRRQGAALPDDEPECPGGPRGDPTDVLRARSRGAGADAAPRRGAPVSADLAARPGEPDGREGARDDDGRARRRALRAARLGDQDPVRRLRRGLHGGARRGRGGGREVAPAARRGRSDDSRRGHPDPALHRAAAAVHRGVPRQGPRGARHRAAVDLRGDHLDDRRPWAT